MFWKKKENNTNQENFTENESIDFTKYKPVLKCSICNGEQVAGFKNLETGKFEDVMLIRNEADLAFFKRKYGIQNISKEY